MIGSVIFFNIVCMQKNNTYIVLKFNKPGAGKGLFVNKLVGQNIIGDNCYLQVEHVDEIVGHFNSHLANKIVVNIDKGYTAVAENSKMKVKISENKFMMESTGLDKIVLDNFINLISTSNHYFCVYMKTSDRPYFVLNCKYFQYHFEPLIIHIFLNLKIVS